MFLGETGPQRARGLVASLVERESRCQEPDKHKVFASCIRCGCSGLLRKIQVIRGIRGSIPLLGPLSGRVIPSITVSLHTHSALWSLRANVPGCPPVASHQFLLHLIIALSTLPPAPPRLPCTAERLPSGKDGNS